MASDYSEILQKIRAMAGTGRETFLVAKVLSVDGDTCTVDCDGMELSDVRLRSVISEDSDTMLLEPAVGSYVLCADLSGGAKNNLAVLLFSKVAKITIKDDVQIEINGGYNGGLINIGDLVQKLNTVEQDLNTLKTVFSTWSPIAQDGGATLKIAAATWYGSTIAETQVSDIEDDKIKH